MSSYCEYAEGHELHGPYHDTEYGFPIEDENRLFERLLLEINQAGLNWELILRKREGFRKADDGFDVDRVADYREKDRERLLADAIPAEPTAAAGPQADRYLAVHYQFYTAALALQHYGQVLAFAYILSGDERYARRAGACGTGGAEGAGAFAPAPVGLSRRRLARARVRRHVLQRLVASLARCLGHLLVVPGKRVKALQGVEPGVHEQPGAHAERVRQRLAFIMQDIVLGRQQKRWRQVRQVIGKQR